LVIILSVLWLSACATLPPQQPDNLCSIFKEHRGWYRDAKDSSRDWGVPIPILMAFIRHESSYQPKARPPRTRILWIIPWKRESSAFGYAQALSETWAEYQQQVGGRRNPGSFDDAVDFVGWYIDRTHQNIGISTSNAYAQYLAYHEGVAGYKQGSYRSKPQVKKFAWRVSATSGRYKRQLLTCRQDLERPWWRRMLPF